MVSQSNEYHYTVQTLSTIEYLQSSRLCNSL